MDSLGRHEDYGSIALEEGSLSLNPLENLRTWLNDAEVAKIYEPNAFVLTAIEASGNPTSRTVLLKQLDDGLVFVTNYLSRKGVAVDANPRVSCVFGWYSIHRQVLVEGNATRVSESESDEYFASRPRGSQIAAWASEQSKAIESRADLDKHYAEIEKRFVAEEFIPRPPHWGGYRIIPERFEFWKGRSNRMHDRILFQKTDSGWKPSRLQP